MSFKLWRRKPIDEYTLGILAEGVSRASKGCRFINTYKGSCPLSEEEYTAHLIKEWQDKPYAEVNRLVDKALARVKALRGAKDES